MTDSGKLEKFLHYKNCLLKIVTILTTGGKKTFLGRCDNDLKDPQTDRRTWAETKGQLSLEGTAGHLLLSPLALFSPPIPSSQNNGIQQQVSV